jgi:adenosine deaminase
MFGQILLMEQLSLDELDKYKDNVCKLSAITSDQIKKIWMEETDDDINLEKARYEVNGPLYLKMYHRLKNEKNVFGLYNGCDPFNRSKLANYFGIKNQSIIIFFAYLKFNLSTFDIENEFRDIYKKDVVEYYYLLPKHLQTELITKFNIVWVDEHNKAIYKLLGKK